MGTVINLNKVRKKKAREDADKTAAENRARYGRTREQKLRDAAETAEAERRMALLRREPASDEP